MRIQVRLQQEKGMRESQVRDAIDRAAATTRTLDEQRGKRPESHEAYREKIAGLAETDRRKGKI